MKKFFVISMLILSMVFLVSCGGKKKVTPNGEDKTDTDTDVVDTDSGDDSDTGDKTDSGQTDTDTDADTTADTDADTTADTDADTTADTDTDTDTDTGSQEPEEDSECEKITFKSFDSMPYSDYEIDLWLYDTEEYDDETVPVFFAEIYFDKSIVELIGKTVSFENSDPNDCENKPCFFLYGDIYGDIDETWHSEKTYFAKKGSVSFEDVNEDTVGSKAQTTSILFYEIDIKESDTNEEWVDVEGGKCYELPAFKWDTLNDYTEDEIPCEIDDDCCSALEEGVTCNLYCDPYDFVCYEKDCETDTDCEEMLGSSFHCDLETYACVPNDDDFVCESSDDCGHGEICEGGYCSYIGEPCDQDLDCDDGQTCEEGFCM